MQGVPASRPSKATARLPRAVVNRRINLPAVPPPPGPAVAAFHRGLLSYAATPLRELPGLAARLGLGLGAVLVKDESQRCGLPSFKILGVSWAVAQTLRQDPRIRTLVSASAGNHGRAVARCAAARGLACRIYLPAAAAAARVAAIAAEGAEVITVDGDYDAAVRSAARVATEPGVALIADMAHGPGVASAGWVVDGYTTLFEEVGQRLAEPVDVLLVPVGVGSLAAAAIRWAAYAGGPPAVVGVEPATAGCVTASLVAGDRVTVATPGTIMAGLDCATPSATSWPTVLTGLAGTVTVDDVEVASAVRELAAAGLAIGASGAAPVAALRALMLDQRCAALRSVIGLDRPARVLCLATEGPTDPAAHAALLTRHTRARPGPGRG